MLNNIHFVWEAQRGGPRRKRKATVAVPPKANPVDIGKMRAKASARGILMRGGASSLPSLPAQEQGPSPFPQGQMVDIGPTLAALGGNGAFIPGVMPGNALQLSAQQWQLLANGAFQATVPQGMGLAGANLFPLASQMPMASTGFQFGSQLAPSPAVWAQTATNQLAALQQHQQQLQQQQPQQQQHQAHYFLNPGAMATPVNPANLQTEPPNKMHNVSGDENGHSQFAENFVANHLGNDNTREAQNVDKKLSAAGIDDKDDAIFYDASS
jgi:hypothetical protein